MNRKTALIVTGVVALLIGLAGGYALGSSNSKAPLTGANAGTGTTPKTNG